jgi:hypothetical protein
MFTALAPDRSLSVLDQGAKGEDAASAAVSAAEGPADLSCSLWKTTIGESSFNVAFEGSSCAAGGIVHRNKPRQQYRSRDRPTRSQAWRSVMPGSSRSKVQYWCSFDATTRPHVKHRTGGRSVIARRSCGRLRRCLWTRCGGAKTHQSPPLAAACSCAM